MTFKRRRRVRRVAGLFGVLLVAIAALGGWLYYRALEIRSEMVAATALVPEFKNELLAGNEAGARASLIKLQGHVARARTAATDPVWKVAASVPAIGKNFAVVSELALSAEDAIKGAAQPLLSVYSSLDLKTLQPAQGKIDVKTLAASSPGIVSAASTIELTYSRLASIDDIGLLPDVAQSLAAAKNSLDDLRRTLSVAADTSRILPNMMGIEGPRNYLLLVQNNAEIRATGGLPGALAVLTFENGTATLDSQTSGASMGKFSPPVKVDPVQTSIYSSRLGTYISDVNLTPDFPTAAKSAKAMWESRHGTKLDGVIGLDPVVLSYILQASGPLELPNLNSELDQRMPHVLTADNVVKVLLSDVYYSTDSNELQDAYFAAVSKEVFGVVASGKINFDQLVAALATSADEHRLQIWSAHKEEQEVLMKSELGGGISGPAVGGAAFGVYFNDGTGAKMDYLVRRTVQLVGTCTGNDYAEYKVKVTLSNTAPPDAASILPLAVTGGGHFGIPPGSVQTNVAIYGPALSHLDSATQDQKKVAFASHLHSDRPVGILTTRLAPGHNAVIEMTFVKVVQHTVPTVAITPTAQAVKDVLLPVKMPKCDRVAK